MSNPNGKWEFDKDGNVHYVPPDGSSNTDTTERTQRTTTPGYTQSRSSKKSDSGWHWFIIVLTFMIAWPIGLILLLLELSGKWPAEKKVQQELSRAANAAKNAAGKAKKSSGTKTAAKTAAAPPLYTAPVNEKAKKRNKKQQEKQEAKAYGLGNIALFRTLGWTLTGIFGFAFIMQLVDEIAYFIGFGYALEQLIPFLAFTLIGITFLGVAGSRSRKLKNIRKYLKLIGSKEEISLSALAKTMGISEKKVLSDVEDMLERDVFETGYIDASRNTLVLREGGIEDIPIPQPEPVETPEQELSTADATLRRIRKINDAIANPELSDKIDRIEELTAKIFRLLDERPEKAGDLRSFMNYYLPQTLKILENYAKLEAQGIEGGNIAEAKQKIEGMMDKLVDGYETQLDKLFADDVLDISADLKVMESMLEKDGLTVENDFKI